MDIMELGAVGELVGGVAVIASLVYVGLQVRHNTRAVEATAHNDLLQYSIAVESLVIGDAEMADIEQRGATRPKELSDVQWRRFRGYAIMTFSYWEAAFLHHRKGMIDAEIWTAWDGAARLMLKGSGYQRAWSEAASAFAPSFQHYVDQEVVPTAT